MYIFETKSGKKMSCRREISDFAGPLWTIRLLGGDSPEYMIGRSKLKYILKDILYYKKNY